MSRNQTGTYTVPNTFQAGTVANPDRVNENFADLGAEMTASLPRDGRAPMLGQLPLAVGTLAQPGLTFTGDENTGFMWVSDGVWAFIVNGVDKLRITADGVKPTNPVAATTIYDAGTLSSGTPVIDYDNGPVQKATMAGNITLLPSDIPEGADLQLSLTYSSGTLAFSGVARWVLGTDAPSATFADTGLNPASLTPNAIYTFIFSRVGSETVGYVARAR